MSDLPRSHVVAAVVTVAAVGAAAWYLKSYFQSKQVVKASGVPRVVVIFSGKRKSGKDYICEKLHAVLKENPKGSNNLYRLSAPLKEQFAKDNNLDYQELLQATAYKEKYRLDMIKWGEEKREKDPGFFARITTQDAKEPIWIIPDARRMTDVEYFVSKYPGIVITVRVEAADAVRQKRGYEFTAGIDDAASECGLDSYNNWTFKIVNEGDAPRLQADLDTLISKILSHV